MVQHMDLCLAASLLTLGPSSARGPCSQHIGMKDWTQLKVKTALTIHELAEEGLPHTQLLQHLLKRLEGSRRDTLRQADWDAMVGDDGPADSCWSSPATGFASAPCAT